MPTSDIPKRSLLARFQYYPARTRLFVFAAIGVVAGFVLPGENLWWRPLIGWDVATLIFLIWVGALAATASTASMRARAAQEDEGVVVSFAASVVAAVASVGAIVALFIFGHGPPAGSKAPELVLAAVTILLSWLFMHAVFALHYAHVFYSPGARGVAEGLEFPGNDDGKEEPDYWDFLYFAYVLGATSQTSDVDIRTKPIRRLALAHGVIAFFFNTTILAMTVNIAGSLI